MPLADNVTSLAARLATEFNSVRSALAAKAATSYVDARAVPVGGSTGQVLTKNSATDRDAGWATAAAGGGSNPAFWTSVKSGAYYPRPWANFGASVNPAIHQLVLYPWHFDASVTIQAIAFKTAAATANRVVRIGIYADAAGEPGSLIQDLGAVSAPASQGYEVAVSRTFTPGRVWMGAVTQNFVTGAAVCDGYFSNPSMPSFYNSLTLNGISGSSLSAFAASNVTGALPATWPGGGAGSSISGYALFLKAA